MIRFLFLSLLLHMLIFWALTRKHDPVIYDGIVSVELSPSNSPPNPDSKPPSAQQKKRNPPTKSEKISPSPVNEQLTSGSESLPPSSGTPLESGRVTLNPKVLKQVKATYPQEAKDAGIQGVVKLSVVIDPTGHVQEVMVLDGPGHGLNETAQEALKQFIFSPAELDGEKVSVRITYLYRFRLDTR